MQNWMITGANGNLGRRLVKTLLTSSEDEVCAVVRSATAARQFDALDIAADVRQRLTVEVLDYVDQARLAEVASQANKVVHLVGILKETRWARYVDAHEGSSQALVTALAGTRVEQVVYLSIVGSRPDSANACLASKGRAEAIIRSGFPASTVLRVPMVLGEGDYASFALGKRARSRLALGFRMSSLEQPIYAGDVVTAVIAAGTSTHSGSLDLAGPQALTRRELTYRAAQALNRPAPLVMSLPIGLGLLLGGAFERLLANPPVTRAMLEVLDHDDAVDANSALQALQMAGLTPLDDMLKAVLR